MINNHGGETIVFHCYKYGLLKIIRHVFRYLSSTSKSFLFDTNGGRGFSEEKMDYGSV